MSVELKPITGICYCGHTDHAPNEPRVCMVLKCNCSKFREDNPFQTYLLKVDYYLAEMIDWEEKMSWVLTNLKFFRNYNNFEIVLAWWKYICHYDPETEFMSDGIKKHLQKNGQPESITRAFRKLKEKCRSIHSDFNPCIYCPFEPTIEEYQKYKQAGIMEWSVS